MATAEDKIMAERLVQGKILDAVTKPIAVKVVLRESDQGSIAKVSFPDGNSQAMSLDEFNSKFQLVEG